MANFFVSYDLNGKTPTHAEMDAHLKKLGKCVSRVLETVWYINTTKTTEELYNYVNGILSNNDRLLVIEAKSAHYRRLIDMDTINNCWK